MGLVPTFHCPGYRFQDLATGAADWGDRVYQSAESIVLSNHAFMLCHLYLAMGGSRQVLYQALVEGGLSGVGPIYVSQITTGIIPRLYESSVVNNPWLLTGLEVVAVGIGWCVAEYTLQPGVTVMYHVP